MRKKRKCSIIDIRNNYNICMNKKLIILCVVLLALTGCKSKKAEPTEVQNDVNSVNRTGQEVLLDNGTTENRSLGDIAVTSPPTEEQVVADDSVIKSLGSFQDVSIVNTNDWYTFLSADYEFRVLYPNDYIIVEELKGEFVLSGEGVGDFYKISVLSYEDSIELGTLVRSNDVSINGRNFTLEEYETDFDSTILSYKINVGDYYYRLTFEYHEGLEDMLDLFVKSAETFIIN